ncbi:hypothetical protein ACT29H_02845 [Thermophagus sp. OGC60D27]|uniref:hypothetical protein n=1 Tax=Thermophagus sp. OGC60D27 TaxID=3458415 RepID=UPI0040384723
MLNQFRVCLFVFLVAVGTNAQPNCQDRLTDREIKHIIETLPHMVSRLREAGITISEAYYIWPRDAALHAKGEKLLEQYGYDALLLDALETFCKTWFCLNYDSLNADRQKILRTTEEHINENPYLSDEQKKINIRILNKSLGHNKEQLKKEVGEDNLRIIRTYCNKISEIWKKLD